MNYDPYYVVTTPAVEATETTPAVEAITEFAWESAGLNGLHHPLLGCEGR